MATDSAVVTEDVTKAVVPQPYSFLFHPLCYWLDKFLSWLFSILFPVKAASRHPPEPVEETMKMKERLQKNFTISTGYRMGPACKKWSKLYGVPLVECIMKIPRQHDILTKWNIIGKDELPKTEANDVVNAIVRFPVSILPDDKKTELLTNSKPSAESGCIQVESFDPANLPADVPVLVWFHGGGLAFGDYNCADGVEAITDIVEKASTFGAAGSLKHPLAILASVQYRLAPENPFPAAPIDGLSAAAYFLESNPLRKIDIAGISAGGYLATVTALETFRRYPDRVKSLCAIAPMLCPSTDTMSYYLESKASLHCHVDFLRWCWKSYLELDESQAEDPVDRASSLEDVLRSGSTRKAWDQCKWKQSVARRLVEPTVDLPSGLDATNAPKVVVVTCTADPLHDDGVQLAKGLKVSEANVVHFDCFGSHVIGYSLDSASKAKVTIEWSEAVFASK